MKKMKFFKRCSCTTKESYCGPKTQSDCSVNGAGMIDATGSILQKARGKSEHFYCV